MEELPPIAKQYGDYLPYLGDDEKPMVLGKGGFGVTICAYRLRRVQGKEFRDNFAIKVLHKDAVQKNSKFFEEIEVLRGFDHPNLVRYIECNDQDGSVFLVMELCRGGDLAALVSRFERLSERAALQILLQLCAGLEVVHRRGFFHCDIKPENILLKQEIPKNIDVSWLENAHESERCFKLLDFGLAGKIDGPVRRRGFAGTAMYASPEQVRERQPDARSDLYSLGMTLWYLVAGRGPLLDANGHEIRDRKQAMKRHTSEEPHDAAFPRGLSEGFLSILSRLVRKKAEERFKSVGELTKAVRAVLAEMQTDDAKASEGPAGTPVAQLPPIGIDTAWGTGIFSDFFDSLTNFGRRGFAKLYQAREKSSGNLVALTAWIPRSGVDDPKEKEVAEHLRKLWEVSNHPNMPPVVSRMVEVRRTAGEWCIAEEWAEGETLDRLLSLRDRIDLDEAARLLWPIAETCDQLRTQGIDHARLNVGDIRVQLPGAENDAWLGKPMEEWGGEWGIRFSLLALPSEFAQEMQQASVSRTVTGAEELDFSTLNLRTSFCRLFYRMIEGAEVPEVASYGDIEAYTEATELGSKSNILLRNYVCGVENSDGREHTITEFLKEICNNEAIYRLPIGTEGYARSTAVNIRHTGAMRTSVESRTQTVPSEPAESEGAIAAENIRISPPPPVAPARKSSTAGARAKSSEHAARGSAHLSTAGPAQNSATASVSTPPRKVLKVATVFRDRGQLGSVQSPYGEHRVQRIEPKDWAGGAQVACAETGEEFLLPKELPPLEAILLPGRFDAVRSPYRGVETPVPLGEWKGGSQLVCPTSGREFVLPPEVPIGTGILVEGQPGMVRSPYGEQPELEITGDLWKPGQRLYCPHSNQDFLLPAELPPLVAGLTETPGEFISPYGPEEPFTLPPHECLPRHVFKCPRSGQALQLPGNLPEWIFDAEARSEPAPAARSPYVPGADAAWQTLKAGEWRPAGTVRCARTQRVFRLPAELPVFAAKVGPQPPSVQSPFSPEKFLPVAEAQWKAGARLRLEVAPQVEAEFQLPADIEPTGDIDTEDPATLDLPRGKQPQAKGNVGTVRSPFEELERIEVPGQDWRPGKRVHCPTTGKSFWLPRELPPLRARRGAQPGRVVSPYTERPVTIAPQDWNDLAPIRDPEDGRTFLLPENLPALPGRVDEGHPGYVESPFAPGWVEVEFPKWKPDEILECPVSHRYFALPATIPEWLLEAVLVPEHIGQAMEPEGGKPFVVKSREWVGGGVIQVPNSKRRLRLPAELPLLTATVVADEPGKVFSPFTGEEVRVPPLDWVAGHRVQDPETGNAFLLPGGLRPLIGKVDEARPGFVESPFAPGQWIELQHSEWRPGEAVTCRATQKRFVLPGALPEWLHEAVLISGMPGQVREPESNTAFSVRPRDWEGGGIVRSPGASRRLKLPAQLPPLTAIAIMDKPGYVRTPYNEEAPPFKVGASHWKPGEVIVCASTKRPLRLPDALPAIYSNWPLILMAVCGLLVIIFGWLVYKEFSKPKVDPNAPPPPETVPVKPTGADATPVVPAGDPLPPKEGKPWPAKVIVEGRSPAFPGATFVVEAGTGLPTLTLDGAAVVTRDFQWEINFAEALKGQKGWPEELEKVTLKIVMQGFAPVEREVPRTAENQTFAKPEWKTQTQPVTWAPHPFYTQYYSSISFRGTGQFTFPIGAGRAEVSPGNYTVELKGKPGAIYVVDRVLPAKLEVAAGKSSNIALPPVAQHLGGLATYRYAPTIQIFGYVNENDLMVSRRPEMIYATPFVLSFNKDFSSGVIYEESSLVGPTSLQLVDSYVAASVTEEKRLNDERRPRKNLPNLQTVAIRKFGEKLNRFGELLKQEGAATVENLLTRRQEMAAIGNEIFEAINREFPQEPSTGAIGPSLMLPDRRKVYFHESVKAWQRMMEAIKPGEAWARIMAACGAGGSVNERDLKALVETGLLVTHPITLTAIDEAGNLTFGSEFLVWKLQAPGTYAPLELGFCKLKSANATQFSLALAVDRSAVPNCTAVLKALAMVPVTQ